MIQLIPKEEVVSISHCKEIIKSYKFEMMPTEKQEVKLNQTLNVCRNLYNWSLGERKDGYKNGGWNVEYDNQQNYLPKLRNINNEFGKALREVYAQVEQDVLKRVDIAYENFFRRIKNNKEGSGKYKKPGFPRFKGYGRYNSFTFPQYGNGVDIRIYKESMYKNGKSKLKRKHILRLSKIGEIKFASHREIGEVKNRHTGKMEMIPYQIKTITIKKEIDKWFLVATVETFVEIQIPVILIKNINQLNQPISLEELNNKCVGIDMGLSNLIMLSIRKKIEPPKFFLKLEKRLAIEQRKLSKKKIEEKEIDIIDNKTKEKKKKKIKVSSKNRDKQIIKVQKVHRKINNQRKNFSHEVSRTLVDNFDLIIFEKLNIQKMMQDHIYAKSIADASWYQIQMFTSYKAEWAGKIVEFVESKNTTKECSKCGHINDIKISDRIFKCVICGHIEDRDLNASIVIRDRSSNYQNLLKNIKIPVGMQCPEFKPLEKEASIQSEIIEQVYSENKETSQERTVPYYKP